MGFTNTPEHLLKLFERDLRTSDAETEVAEDAPHVRRGRVSRELDVQVLEFVEKERESGRTPEQMLVELKKMLTRVAPDVPGSQRNAFIASVTERAINAFFGKRERGPVQKD